MSRRRSLHRPTAGPLAGSEMLRIGSLILVLAVIGMMYFRAREPGTWRWLADDDPAESRRAAVSQEPSPASAPVPETIIDGPNDTDEEQRVAFHEFAEALTDNRPLAAEEMFAYWRLFDWARATPFRDLWKRAEKHVLFAQLFGNPDDYRGLPIALDLHVKRVLKHPASPREARPVVYEAWGATDDSKTFPYCVLFLDKPPELPLGDDLNEEARFAGYFLKNLQYRDKLDKSRGAPLLIGRIEWRENPGKEAYEASRTNSPWEFWVAIGGFAAFLIVRWYLRPRPSTIVTTTTRSPSEGELNDWLNAAEQDQPDNQSHQ